MIIMNLLIRSGLIGGAIGGEAMVLLVLLNTILLRNFAQGNFSENQPFLVFVWAIVYPLLVILIFEIGGIFSAWLCRKNMPTGKDAFIPGIITGITMGIIFEIMWIANILSLAAHASQGLPGYFTGQENSLMVIGLLVLLVMMGSILSSFGSYIFSQESLKIQE
jgi:hypothetical protein